jgi:hypothetical protein
MNAKAAESSKDGSEADSGHLLERLGGENVPRRELLRLRFRGARVGAADVVGILQWKGRMAKATSEPRVC